MSGYLRQNILGLVAIFLALNAGAYAVTTGDEDPAKTVFNQDLANSSVDGRVLAAGAVAGPDIAAAAVGPKKMKLDKLVKFLQTRVNAQCAAGESVQGILADGSVICAADDVNPGTITGVTTGGGLTGGGTSGSVALGVDPSVLQQRVTGACLGNQAVQSVAQNGGVGCSTITANGAAGGDLTGTYPDPTLDTGVVGAANFAALPGGKMMQTTCQTVANGSFHGVEFDTLAYGNSVDFDDAADSLKVLTAGTYLVTAYAEWEQNGDGDRALGYSTGVPGADGFDARVAASSTTQGQTVVQLVQLPADTTITVQAGQGSTGPLDFVDFGAGCASLSVQWLAP